MWGFLKKLLLKIAGLAIKEVGDEVEEAAEKNKKKKEKK